MERNSNRVWCRRGHVTSCQHLWGGSCVHFVCEEACLKVTCSRTAGAKSRCLSIFVFLIIKMFLVYVILLKPSNQVHANFLPWPGHEHSYLLCLKDGLFKSIPQLFRVKRLGLCAHLLRLPTSEKLVASSCCSHCEERIADESFKFPKTSRYLA